jgi:hypothetical protein
VNENPFEDRDHAKITRSEVMRLVTQYVAERWPQKKAETIVLPSMNRQDSYDKPGYVLFK